MPKTQAKYPHVSDDTLLIINELDAKFKKIEALLNSQSNSTSVIPETFQPKEVCNKMGWSRSKFEQFKGDGLFRTFKIGGKVYVYTSDLKALFPKDFF